MKPSPLAFMKLIKWCSITQKDTCYFFEDSIYNLIVGSSLGWQTIFINPNKNSSTNNRIELDTINDNGQKVRKIVNINYSFKNINEALQHFVCRLP
jgi:hypothetical protein